MVKNKVKIKTFYHLSMGEELRPTQPDGTASGEAVGTLRFQPRNGHEAKTQALIRKAYEKGQGYQKPPLSDKARIAGGYTWDEKPPDFDNQCLVRETATPVHSDVLKCSMQGSFIDKSIFTDTNILLEILQNAEPKDSKGTWFGLEFYAEGKWRTVIDEIDKFPNELIQAVRIVDNGRGYLPTDMTTIGGGKRDDIESAGRFGTGMKISDRSALGKGVAVTRYSRNWKATPYLEPVLTSAGDDYTVSYQVEFFEDTHQGSVVEYRNLTPEIFAALRRIQDLYLPLDKTMQDRLVAHNRFGIILNPKDEHGDFKVHGRSYALTYEPGVPLLFSYDLHACDIDDQNRHYADTARVTENIREIWNENSDPELFKKLLQAAKEEKKFHELDMSGLNLAHPDVFKEAAKEVFQITDFNTVYIDNKETTENDRKILKRQGYQSIKTGQSRCVNESFETIGVLTGRKFIQSTTEEVPHLIIPVSDYAEESFPSAVCRAIGSLQALDELKTAEKEMLVVLQNHDNGETVEMPFEQFIRNPKDKKLQPVEFIIKVKNGRLKDKEDGWRRLVKWHRKHFDAFIGACAAAGVEASIYNGNEELNPFKNRSYAEAHLRTWSNLPPRDFEIHIYIENQTQATELGKLHKYSLNLDPDYAPVVSTEHGDIVTLGEGQIYEQGIKKGNLKDIRRILSYNIPQAVNEGNLGTHVTAIINASRNIEVQRAILVKAKDTATDAEFIEFGTVPTNPESKKLWKQAFEEVFGQTTVLDDCEEESHRELILSAVDSSGIKTVRLNKKLCKLLLECGVKKLSSAVRAEKVKVFDPDPLKTALLLVSRIVQRAIEKALPDGISPISQNICLAREVMNCYEQSIRTGSGYLDPINPTGTIFVFDEAVQNKQIEQLVTFILNKKVEAYRPQMDIDRYTEFKSRVLALAEKSITTISFFRRIRTMIFNKERRITNLVEKVISEIDKGRREEAEAFVLESEAEPTKIQEIMMAIRGKIEEIRQKVAARRARLEQAKSEAKKRKLAKEATKELRPRRLPLPKVKNPAGVLLYTAAAALLVIYGPRLLPDKVKQKIAETAEGISSILPDMPNEVEHFFSSIGDLLPGSNEDEYSRPTMPDYSPIGVSMERSSAGSDDFDDASDYLAHQRSNFLSYPPLEWGRWMAEQALTEYTGKGWQYNANAPDFENPKFPEIQRTTHSQKVKPKSKVNIRTMAGGYIDEESIKLLLKDGTENSNFRIRPAGNREYEVEILDGNAAAIVYQTVMSINWMDKAESLTDADFAQLPADVFAYYTNTGDIDMTRIKFSPKGYPHFQNLADFINHLKQLKPFERIKILRSVVGKMRYATTERTEKAFGRFHLGQTPQKDFLEFILDSGELEMPGDGDCDAQNSTFALLARLAGIPAKLDFVFTENGVGHGPATIYLPKVGWVLSDTMGERIIQESIVSGGNEFMESGQDSFGREGAHRHMLQIMRGRRMYYEEQCDDLWNGNVSE